MTRLLKRAGIRCLLLLTMLSAPGGSQECHALETPELSLISDRLAQDSGERERKERDPNTRDGEKAGLLGRYMNYLDRRVQEILLKKDQLWGLHTLTVPDRIFSVKFLYNAISASQRYGSDGKLGPFAPTISFPNPFGIPGDFMNIDVDFKGKGAGLLITFFYGLTDPLDLYMTCIFYNKDLNMDIKFTPGSSSLLGIRTEENLKTLLEALGRPYPKTRYKSKSWEPGDFHFGFLYNYFRNDYFSAMIKPRMILPTQKMADPNESFIYLLGPNFDVDKGALGLGTNNRFDLRFPEPFKFIALGLDFMHAYSFRSERESPKFLKPDPFIAPLLNAIGFESEYFPDLSGLDETYYITHGHRIEVITTVMFSGPFFGIGGAYGYTWSQKPKIESNSPAFEEYLEAVSAFPEAELRVVSAFAALQLFQFNIPAVVKFEARFCIGGRSSIKYDDDMKLDIQIFIPI